MKKITDLFRSQKNDRKFLEAFSALTTSEQLSVFAYMQGLQCTRIYKGMKTESGKTSC